MKHNFEKVTWTDHTGLVWVDKLCTYCGLEFAGGKEECDVYALWKQVLARRYEDA